MESPKNHNSLIVGVIASRAELSQARRLRRPPDLWELRADCLPQLSERDCTGFGAPLLITARHPAEGGHGNISSAGREALLLRFLPQAGAIDLELRSLRALKKVWRAARKRKLTRICSFHDFGATPSLSSLRSRLRRAMEAGCDIFKVATRAETPAELITLIEFSLENAKAVAVMATGPFGPLSRQILPRCGSRLVYASLRSPLHEGQSTLRELRRALGR